MNKVSFNLLFSEHLNDPYFKFIDMYFIERVYSIQFNAQFSTQISQHKTPNHVKCIMRVRHFVIICIDVTVHVYITYHCINYQSLSNLRNLKTHRHTSFIHKYMIFINIAQVTHALCKGNNMYYVYKIIASFYLLN